LIQFDASSSVDPSKISSEGVPYAVVVGPGRPICFIALAAQCGIGWYEGIAILDMADTSRETIVGFQPSSTIRK
jgi:hypothetical protein